MDIAVHESYSPREQPTEPPAQPAESPRPEDGSHELPQQNVIDKMIQIVDSNGGELLASQVVLLYRGLRGAQVHTSRVHCQVLTELLCRRWSRRWAGSRLFVKHRMIDCISVQMVWTSMDRSEPSLAEPSRNCPI